MPVTLPPSLIIKNDPAPTTAISDLTVIDVGACFSLANRSTSRHQYASSYWVRLNYLTPFLKATVAKVWGSNNVVTMSQLMSTSYEARRADDDAILIGVIHKQMKLKPSILDIYTKALDLHFPSSTSSYVSNDDFAFLEDQDGRLELIWPQSEDVQPLETLVTGIVVALKGTLLQAGQFKVNDVLLPNDLMAPRPVSLSNLPGKTKGPLVALVSNLRIADPKANLAKLIKLKEWLISGMNQANRVARVIVVGNAAGKLQPAGDPVGQGHNESKFKSADVDHNALVAITEMDNYLDALSSILPIDIVSGSEDPTTYALPQLPIPPRIFQRIRQRASFQSLSNPSLIDIHDSNESPATRILLTSSQPMEDIARYTKLTNPVDALTLCIRAQLICPTSPDTLSSVPMPINDLFCIPTPCVTAKAQNSTIDHSTKDDRYDTALEHDALDKTILENAPDIIITGGHGKSDAIRFETKCGYTQESQESSRNVLGICVADFHTTGDVILLNINTKTIESVVKISA